MTHRTQRQPIVFVSGPFPPPVHGLAVVNQYVAEALASRIRVKRFNIAGPIGRSTPWPRAHRAMLLAAKLAELCYQLVRDRPVAIIIGSSAGGVMLFDAAISLLAAAARTPVYVYHHSFAYLRTPTTHWYHRLGMRLMRNQHHIVLCDHMRDALARQHTIALRQISVVSNAAFIPPTEQMNHARIDAALCLGFISSITVEKGIFEFLALVSSLRQQKLSITALIAGPVDADLAEQFHQRLTQVAPVEYLGAVSAAAKVEFFQRIDLLILPSRHIHEAEPLVMIESLSNGVPVIATRRGCLPTAWADASAVHVIDEADFVAQASKTLAPWFASSELRLEWSCSARRAHRRMHMEATTQFDTVAKSLQRHGGTDAPDFVPS